MALKDYAEMNLQFPYRHETLRSAVQAKLCLTEPIGKAVKNKNVYAREGQLHSKGLHNLYYFPEQPHQEKVMDRARTTNTSYLTEHDCHIIKSN